jgi:hypothetical protein
MMTQERGGHYQGIKRLVSWHDKCLKCGEGYVEK